MNSNISDKDKKDWENFISSKEKITNKDQDLSKEKIHKSKSLDLHGHSLDEANRKVKDLILDSYDKGIEKLTIITGKGIHSQNEKDPFVSKQLGILKYSVPDYLNKDLEITSIIKNIEPAKIDDGGEGAFYIYLRKKK